MACWPGVDTKYDPNVLVIDLDPSHEGANKVALGGPIRLIQPITDQACEGLQLADDEVQRARVLDCVAECGGLGLKLGNALAQPCQSRFERICQISRQWALAAQ